MYFSARFRLATGHQETAQYALNPVPFALPTSRLLLVHYAYSLCRECSDSVTLPQRYSRIRDVT